MRRPRWLDASELDAWLQVVALTEYLPAALDAQLKRDADLGRYEYSVLVLLSDAHGAPVRMSELSVGTFGSLSRLSHAVSRLEVKQLVTRERRGLTRYCSITPNGSRILAQAARGHAELVRRTVFDNLAPGGAAGLADALRPIVAVLQDDAGQVAGRRPGGPGPVPEDEGSPS